jgi:hypothetical protein
MDFIDLQSLLDTLWNASAPNVRGMWAVEGKPFVTDVLWPKLQRFDAATVRAAMVAEIAEGSPPQIRDVAVRCVNATADWKQGPSSEVTDQRNASPPLANPFDESRRQDREYRAGRLCGAMMGYAFAANKFNALRYGAEFAGMSEDELWGHISAHIEAQAKPRRGPQAVSDVMAGLQSFRE